MASLEIASRDQNKKENKLKSLVKDCLNSCCAFPIVDSGNNENGKTKNEEVSLEGVCKMNVRDRENELEWLVDRHSVSKFSYGRRLQAMLQERHPSKLERSDILSPRQSHWEYLKKLREFKVRNKNSEKDDLWNLIKRRTVSRFLASDLREKIDNILILQVQKRLEVESNLVEEDKDESLVECSERYQENREDNETDKESKMICDLKEQIKQLQREILELKSVVKSCVDIKKFKPLSGKSSEDVRKMIMRDRRKELEWLVDRHSVSKFSNAKRLQNPKYGDWKVHRSKSAKIRSKSDEPKEEWDFGVFSGIEGIEKPDPRIYKLALERAGNIEPDEVLHIGDSIRKDYVPAKSIGMHAF